MKRIIFDFGRVVVSDADRIIVERWSLKMKNPPNAEHSAVAFGGLSIGDY